MNSNEISTRPEITRRHFLWMSGAAAGAVVLGACGGDDDDSDPADDAGVEPTSADEGGGLPKSDLEVVRFDFNTPNKNAQAAYWVGISKGYFSEVGIDLQPSNVTAIDDVLTAILSGDVDIALVDAADMFAAEDASVLNGSPNGLRWVGCVFGQQPVVMVAREGVTADSLHGLTIGGSHPGTANEALAKYMLEQMGYDWQTDVNFVNLTGGANDWLTAMISGNVDATIAFPQHIAIAEEAGGGAIYNTPRAFPQAGLAVLQSTLDKYPDFVAAWNHAYIKGHQFLRDPANWQEAREIVANEFGLDYPDSDFNAMELSAIMMTADLGWNPDEMDDLLEFQQSFVGFRADMPWRDYVVLEPLHAAQAALGLAPNPTDLDTGVTTPNT